jgi:hypothetical protein
MAERATSTARRRRPATRSARPVERARRHPTPVSIPHGARFESGRSRRVSALAASWWVAAIACVALAASGVVATALAALLGVLAALLVLVAVANARLAAPRRMLMMIGGRRADAAGDARLVNLVDGLCFAFGLSLPNLIVLDDGAPNALALGSKDKASVVVTSGALSLLGRIELEALLAHELAHIRRGDTARATSVVRAIGIYAATNRRGARLAERLGGAAREALADRAAIVGTQYPPGLADALEALAGAPSVVPSRLSPIARRLTAWQWCAPLDNQSTETPRPGALSLSERVAALREL